MNGVPDGRIRPMNFCVVMLVRDRRESVGRTILSALAENVDAVVIVIYDSPRDGSAEIARSLAGARDVVESQPDSRRVALAHQRLDLALLQPQVRPVRRGEVVRQPRLEAVGRERVAAEARLDRVVALEKLRLRRDVEARMRREHRLEERRPAPARADDEKRLVLLLAGVRHRYHYSWE